MVVYNEYTDDELVRLIVNSNERAFELLYTRHWTHLYQFALYILKDTDSSKDIVQDVFIWVWDQRHTLNVNNVKAYLKAAVRFKTANYIRFGNIRDSLFDELAKFPQSSVSPAADELTELKELQRVIYEAVSELPEKCQEIYRLSKEEGLSNREIANRLGISVKTVEAQMTIALKRIRSKALLYVFLIILNNI